MSEALNNIIAALTSKIEAAGGMKNKIKFVLDEGANTIFVDPQGVRLEDGDAEVTVHAREKTLAGVFDGSINPMIAFMAGKFNVEGDTKVAASLKDIFM